MNSVAAEVRAVLIQVQVSPVLYLLAITSLASNVLSFLHPLFHKNSKQVNFSLFLSFFFIFLVGLEFELRALHLQSRHSAV
jgi:hypothetical protein